MTAVLLASLLAQPPAPAEPVRVPYRLTDTKHVLVRVKLNGKGPFNLILDTGAPAVFVPKKLAGDIGLAVGDDGWGRFDRFELEGGLTVPGVRARVEDLFQLEGMNGLGLAGVELHGVVGYNVLAKYRITYDFTADALTFAPLPGFTPPAVSAGRTAGGQGGLEILGPVMKLLGAFMGISPNFDTRPRGFLGFTCRERDDKVVVAGVLAGGPADAAGLKPGDVLVRLTVGDKAREVVGTKALDRALAGLKPGDAVGLEVARDAADSATMRLTLTAGKGL